MAHQEGARLGLAVWNEDEAGPFQTMPQPGASWQEVAHPVRQSHEYERCGTAKMLTLLHPATGQVRVQGVISSANVVLHPWLQQELGAILQELPPVVVQPAVGAQAEPGTATAAAVNRAQWERWQAGLTARFTLPAELPPLRMLLILDNLAGHKTPALVCWLMAQGIMPLYTPLGGSWLNMAESVQRILTRRALSGQHPQSSAEIIAWLESTARAWNRQPTPFVWGGKRQARRQRAYARRHGLPYGYQSVGGSGACVLRLVNASPPSRYAVSEGSEQRLCA
jgi:hypothetical protein